MSEDTKTNTDNREFRFPKGLQISTSKIVPKTQTHQCRYYSHIHDFANALDDFKFSVGETGCSVRAAHIWRKCQCLVGNRKTTVHDPHIILYSDWTEAEKEEFLEKLDFTYEWHLSKEVFGFVWFTDGTWLERSEDDESNYWKHRRRPDEPRRPIQTSQSE